MYRLLNILVRRLRFLRIYHINIVIFLHLTHAAFYLVRIEYQNQMHLPVTLIIAQNIHQLTSGGLQINLRQFFQFFPRIDNIVAVHQKVLFFRLLFFAAPIFSAIIISHTAAPAGTLLLH